jgi:outer membrane protein
MHRKIIVILIVVMLSAQIPSLLSADEKGKNDILRLSLKEVREYAVKHSIETRNAGIDVAMAKKKIWETTATGLPQIDGKISYMDNIKIPTTLIPAKFMDADAGEDEFVGVKFGTQHNATAEITLSQLVFSGSYIVALQASHIYLQLSKDQLEKSEIDIKETVSKTYYLILLAEDNKKILESNLKNVEKTYYETSELHKAGFIEDTDVDQIQLTKADLENAVKSIDRQIEVTRNLLKFQMGLDLTRKIQLTETLTDIMNRIDNDKMLNARFSLEKHIDYRALDTQVKSMRLLWKREKAEFLPTISAFMTHSQTAMRDKFNLFDKKGKWFPATIIGLNVQIPIFSSGMRAAKVAQAKMDWKKAINSKKQVADGLRLELIQARSAFSDALDKANHTKKSVVLAKRIYEKTLVKFGKGTATSLELTQTHSQYLTAESNYTRAAVDLLNAKTRLDKVLSRL